MDNSYEQRKQELTEEISAAFDGVSREDGVSLHEAMAIDNHECFESRAQARARDTEARWQDVPDEDIGWSDAVLSFLNAEGFRYYIPAYIVWFLRHTDSDDPKFDDSNTFSSVVGCLGRGDILSAADDFVLDQYKILTPQQSRAIAHFLVFQSEREEKWREENEEALFLSHALGEVSRERIDAYLERVRQAYAASGPPENTALYALHNWWGQFL